MLDLLLYFTIALVWFAALDEEASRIRSARAVRTLTVTLTADVSQFVAAMEALSQTMQEAADSAARFSQALTEGASDERTPTDPHTRQVAHDLRRPPARHRLRTDAAGDDARRAGSDPA